MSKLATWLNSVGIQDQKANNKSKIGWKPSKLFLTQLWHDFTLRNMDADRIGHLANFDFSNVCMNRKWLTLVVTIPLRTIFNLEQCEFIPII